MLAPWSERFRAASDESARDEIVREAWECCASEELVPVEWLSSDRRWLRVNPALVRAAKDGTLSFLAAESTELIDHPPTIEACLAMASDARGVLAAEELWRFVLTALRAWKPMVPALPVPVWRIDGLAPEISTGLMEVYAAPKQQLPYERLGLEGERAFSGALGKRAPTGWPLFIARLARSSAYFDELISAKVTAISIDGLEVTVIDADSPFHRAAELFAMGYGIEWSSGSQQLRLVAMPVR